MKLLLLKIILQRRARDEGFTLPMVIALGLVMILLGAINITAANEENLNAITQNSRSDALAIAEVGVTRYRELLDRNRILALYDSRPPTAAEATAGTNTDLWSGRADVCNDNISSFAVGTTNAITINEDGQVLNNDGDSTDAFATGSYSLVSYDYSNTDGVLDLTSDAANNNATGTLTVRSTTPDGNQAQIEVDIPIRINTSDMGNLAPALWIGDNTVTATDLGNLTIDDGNASTTNDGNVVIRDQAVTTSGSEADGCRDFSDTDTTDGSQDLATARGLSIVSDPRAIPSIQPIIDIIAAAKAVTGDQTNSTVGNVVGQTTDQAYVEPAAGTTFDESTDCANVRDCRYYYDLVSTSFTDDVIADGIAQVTMYINGTLNISPPGTGSSMRIGSGVASNYFEIYVDNGQKITIDTSGGATVNIDAFIHAPGSQLEITGNGTVNINGSVWVNDYVASSTANVNITLDDSNISSSVSNKAYEFYTTSTNRTARPIIGSPTNWKTEEAN